MSKPTIYRVDPRRFQACLLHAAVWPVFEVLLISCSHSFHGFRPISTVCFSLFFYFDVVFLPKGVLSRDHVLVIREMPVFKKSDTTC